MIVTELYNGQGLGNQLWCYVVTRVIAADNNYDFGIISPEKFKGNNILNLDFGKQVVGGESPEGGPPTSLPDGINVYYREKHKEHPHFRCDISPLDLGLVNVCDNTKIEGVMQSVGYINHRKSDILKWLQIKDDNTHLSENTCIIHVRGGDFRGVSETILPKSYFVNSMEKIKLVNKDVEFAIVTDDVQYARNILPDIKIIGSSNLGAEDSFKASHHLGGPIEHDYSIINKARYLILSNSSFSWWAAYTNTDLQFLIAPKYWAKHNISNGFWSTEDIMTPGWNYVDKEGNLFSYEDCRKEFNEYKNGLNNE